MVCPEWDEEQWRYWCLPVGFLCKPVLIFLRKKLLLKSKKWMLFLLDSCVNFVLGWSWLRLSKNVLSLSSPWVQINKLSLTYRSHIKDLHYLQKLSYRLIHSYARVCWGTFSVYGYSGDLMLNLTIKFKKVVFQFKFCHFD